MSSTLPPDVRARIDAHLDAVENQLQSAGADRVSRRGIADDLETQILDMLGARGSQRATLADVNEILNRLDPPEAYVKESVPAADVPHTSTAAGSCESRLCRVAVRGVSWIGAGVMGMGVLIVGSQIAANMREGFTPPPWMRIVFVATTITAIVGAIVGPIWGTVLGWAATKRIRRSGGAQRGLGLAVIAALFYPVLIVSFLAFVVSNSIMFKLFNSRGGNMRINNGDYQVAELLLWISWAFLLSLALVSLLRRATGAPRRASRPSERLRELRPTIR